MMLFKMRKGAHLRDNWECEVGLLQKITKRPTCEKMRKKKNRGKNTVFELKGRPQVENPRKKYPPHTHWQSKSDVWYVLWWYPPKSMLSNFPCHGIVMVLTKRGDRIIGQDVKFQSQRPRPPALPRIQEEPKPPKLGLKSRTLVNCEL